MVVVEDVEEEDTWEVEAVEEEEVAMVVGVEDLIYPRPRRVVESPHLPAPRLLLTK